MAISGWSVKLKNGMNSSRLIRRDPVLPERDCEEALGKHALHGPGEQKGRARFIECGEDRAMGVYTFSENVGGALGPVRMGWLMFRTPLFPSAEGFCGIAAWAGPTPSLPAEGKRVRKGERFL